MTKMEGSYLVVVLSAVILAICTFCHCGTRCKDTEADVVFLLDASDSVGKEKFQKMKRFLGNFARLAEDKISPSQVRLSAISFSTKATIEFSLEDCGHIQDLLGANMTRLPDSGHPAGCIGNISYRGGGRQILPAMQLLGKYMTGHSRQGAAKLVVLMTSRLKNDVDISQAEVKRLHALGIHTLAIDVSRESEQTSVGSPGSWDSYRFGTLDNVNSLHRTFLKLVCRGGKKRVKRAWFDHFGGCGGKITQNADPGKTCATVSWTPPDDNVDRREGGAPGDCFKEGTSHIKYIYDGWLGASWINGDSCGFDIVVTVIRCPTTLPATISNGNSLCSGEEYNVYGSKCTYQCNEGYVLQGHASVTCQNSGQWDKSVGVQRCAELCSWVNSHCWPGVCAQDLAENCQCQQGFNRRQGNPALCDLNTPPVLSTCRLSVTDSGRHSTNSTYISNLTNCQNQRNEGIRTEPIKVHFVVKAGLDMPLVNHLPHINESKVGVVGINVSLIKVNLTGNDIIQRVHVLTQSPVCTHSVSSTNPLVGGTELDCEDNVSVPVLNLQDGESLCILTEAFSGGYYQLLNFTHHDKGQVLYQPVTASKRICFIYDHSKPVHCSDTAGGCSSEPIKLSTRLTRSSRVSVVVDGWLDPIPPGGHQGSASLIDKYRLEVHAVDVNISSLSVQHAAIENLTKEWEAESVPAGGPYTLEVSLPEEGESRLYALILEVHDHAGNVAYARRIILFDNSSTVELFLRASLWVTSANANSSSQWQTDVSMPLCVNWTGRFYNTEMYHNNLLQPVNPDSNIQPAYDQTSGILPVSGTDNVHGVIKFEMSWGVNSGLIPEADRISSGNLFVLEMVLSRPVLIHVYSQTTCLNEQLLDGQTYHVVIRGTDIMDNFKEDRVHVSIDHSDPELEIIGLKGRLNQDVVYVHNNTDLSLMVLMLQAADPHSGMLTLRWKLGTYNMSDNLGEKAFAVQRLSNGTTCDNQEKGCYCPSVGVCELAHYEISFPSLVEKNTHKGQHHRKYYFTITATNHASLITVRTLEILLDDSPPSVGVVWEGLGDPDKAEMDFTSNPFVHVRWHGFLDHESGILQYRVILAEKCLTGEEMDATMNATVIEQGTTVTLGFPREGLYYTTVVAYNGAMEASRVACSDGIAYDTSPPRLHNVNITNGRVEKMLGCAQTEQTWLLNSNLTRVKLSNTTVCHLVCFQNSSVSDIEHFPISSDHTIADEESERLCQTLPRMTENSYISLPSDYLKVGWKWYDLESDVENYYIGIGSDRTTALAPDLLPFTSTQDHPEYHARHAGLSHGDVFFIFLQAFSKAGLDVNVILGPILIDFTPPDVRKSLLPRIQREHFVLTWDTETFVDTEQPENVDLIIFYRIGHEDDFIIPFQSHTNSTSTPCQTSSTSGCIRYPVSVLQTYNTESGRRFFYQLHVINAAGHVATVNSSSVPLPDRFPPRHAVIRDVIKTARLPHAQELLNSVPNPEIEAVEDVDVILHSQELCIAWNGFHYNENITVETGVGTAPDLDNAIAFTTVPNTGFSCVNSESLPDYTQLFSIVRSRNSAGTAVFSSDGFVMIPKSDSNNRLKSFVGKGCSSHDLLGSHVLMPSEQITDFSLVSDISIHKGDVLFVEYTPFSSNVVFSNAVSLYMTLSGHQIVAKSSHVSSTLLTPRSGNTTVRIMNCLKDEPDLHSVQNEVTINWEITGQWVPFIKYFNIKMFDQTCMDSLSQNRSELQQCLVVQERAGSSKRMVNIRDQHIYSGHFYFTNISACFDGSCASAAKSDLVQYIKVPRAITFEKAKVTAESSEKFEMEIKASLAKAEVNSSEMQFSRCVFMWAVSRDRFGSTPLTDWVVGESATCSPIEIRDELQFNRTTRGTIFACLQLIFPWRASRPSCQPLHRIPGSSIFTEPFHVIELPMSTFRQTDFQLYLQSQQLGNNIHTLYNLEMDFARSGTVITAVMTDGFERNVTWFLMATPGLPADGGCIAEPNCLTSKRSDTGKVVFSKSQSKLQEGHVYFVCALAGDKSTTMLNRAVSVTEVCGDGFVIDDSPPAKGIVVIENTESGYLGNSHQVLVSWIGFSDVETLTDYLPDEITFNYSVALGSYPGGEDIFHFVPVGQRTTYTFQYLDINPGLTCIATVKAEDRLGHVTQVSSDAVIIDSTPPSVGELVAGVITQAGFIRGDELPVQWEDVEDNESGVDSLEVSISNEGSETEIIPYQKVEGSSAILTNTASILDGHSYVVLLKTTNRAGLTSLTSSELFVVDSSPPNIGVVWNSGSNSSIQASYSTNASRYEVYWKDFSDPHSGIAYYRVGLGSESSVCDVIPFVYIGLQTTYTWNYEFQQGKKYFAIVEACNRAGLCCMTSSNSITFDSSPPTAGYVSVGFDDRHSKYLGHRSSLPVQWTGFSDPQTGIQEYWWCVGSSPETCDVVPSVHTMVSRNTQRSGLSLPEATPLYVTVQARNPAGLDMASASDSFRVDLSPPETVIAPYFLSPRDGSRVLSQWDRSLLYLAWEFRDYDSSVVRQIVYIRSKLTGRLLVEPISAGADTELKLALDSDHLVVDGDSYWATVVSCNGANLCTTSQSELLLIDSTPPVVGTIESPLVWTKQTSHRTGRSVTSVNVTWKLFSDPESSVLAYYVAAGTKYDGQDLTHGQLKTVHDDLRQRQSLLLEINSDLGAGDVIYLSIIAENSLGLLSPVLRLAFDVFVDNANGTSGLLVLVQYSCDAFYCTKECTCAPTGQVCDISTPKPACQELNSTDPKVSGIQVIPHIGLPTTPQTLTNSAKCLEGHWRLGQSTPMSSVSRFEWSYGLADMSPGEGIFDIAMEKVWHDVGTNMTAVHCLPGRKILDQGRRYILHVRVWISAEESVTFRSDPIVVDHTPPNIHRGKAVLDSDASCGKDLDYITTGHAVMACWQGVFLDQDSDLFRYEVWMGSSPLAADLVNRTVVGLNTSRSFPTAAMDTRTRYFVSVRAWSSAGLQTTAVSDGVLIDSTPPTPGVVYNGRWFSNLYAQTSATALSASWSGFEDRGSGVASYQVAVYGDREGTSPVFPFRNVGVVTSFIFDSLRLRHGQRYKISVKAKDAAGLESQPAVSASILIDNTPPEGVVCKRFRLQAQQTLVYEHTSEFHYVTFSTSFPLNILQHELVKVELYATNLSLEAAGYIETYELKMPLIFKLSQNGSVSAQHEFLYPTSGIGSTLVKVVDNADANITAKLYVCDWSTTSDDEAVVLHHMTEFIVSVCSKVRDRESGIRSMKVGLGTTPGGLQVQYFKTVGYSGHLQITTEVQHGAPLYAVVVVENFAGLVSRFISRPIYSDRSPPNMSNVTVRVTYPGDGLYRGSDVLAAAAWTVADPESGVVSCICYLKGQGVIGTARQQTNGRSPGACQWRLQQPRHGSSFGVVVSCMNGIQIHKTVTSSPHLLLLQPPDLTQAHLTSLSNNPIMSPYDDYETYLRSTNSSLQFCWNGIDDPTITQFQYRFVYGWIPSRWTSVDAYKSCALLESSRSLSPEEVVVQLRSLNDRNMMSEIVSATVRLDDSKPTLRWRRVATVTRSGNELVLNWQDVFSVTSDVIYSIFAGTEQGYGNVLNHVTTKLTSYRGRISSNISTIFVSVQAVYSNGLSEIYSDRFRI